MKAILTSITFMVFLTSLQAQYLSTSGGTMTGNLNMSSGTQIQSPYYGFVYGAPQPSTSNNVAIFANSNSTTVDFVGWSNGWRFVPGNTSSYPAPVVTFSSAGAVAIGSTTSGLPAGGSALTLRGPNTPAGGSGFQDINYSFNNAGSARIRGYRGGSWDTYLQFLVNGVSQGSDAPTVAMHIDQTGNIGIGNTSPTSKMDVTGAVSIGSGSVNPNTTKMFMRNPAGKTWAVSSGLNMVNEVDFGIYNWTDNASTPLVNVSSTGNVGIGIVNPAAMLHIKGSSSDAHINLETKNGGAKWQLISIQSTNNFAIADVMSGTSPFVINKGAPNNTMNISNNGNILINENAQVNTNYKLDVGGAARANKVVVNTTGADFVFDSTYDLKSLSTVENYIQQNKHLPDIEPAAEMQKDGLDLGSNQTKLLQKIEELTLYMIEQNKKIEALQAEIKKIKKNQ